MYVEKFYRNFPKMNDLHEHKQEISLYNNNYAQTKTHFYNTVIMDYDTY